MTICVAVAVYDGVVFAADSASSLAGLDANGAPMISNGYRHGNKVFDLVKGLPLVAMTCGLGNFGRAPIAAMSKDLRRLMSDPNSKYYIHPFGYTMSEVAIKARDFLYTDRFGAITPPPAAPHSFEYWIAGFASGSELHEIWKTEIRDDQCGSPILLQQPGEVVLSMGGSDGSDTPSSGGFQPFVGPRFGRRGYATPSSTKPIARDSERN